jgi:hypothetical protein
LLFPPGQAELVVDPGRLAGMVFGHVLVAEVAGKFGEDKVIRTPRAIPMSAVIKLSA